MILKYFSSVYFALMVIIVTFEKTIILPFICPYKMINIILSLSRAMD
jgi:hypothetical protein